MHIHPNSLTCSADSDDFVTFIESHLGLYHHIVTAVTKHYHFLPPECCFDKILYKCLGAARVLYHWLSLFTYPVKTYLCTTSDE